MQLVGAANNVPGAELSRRCSRSVFSVAAHAEPDPWRWYYNPRPPVEFGAWGVDVPIAWKDGGSTVATGNSFAAPHIAGLWRSAPRPSIRRLTPFEAQGACWRQRPRTCRQRARYHRPAHDRPTSLLPDHRHRLCQQPARPAHPVRGRRRGCHRALAPDDRRRHALPDRHRRVLGQHRHDRRSSAARRRRPSSTRWSACSGRPRTRSASAPTASSARPTRTTSRPSTR